MRRLIISHLLGVFGIHDRSVITVNNVTIVPVEQLTDEELDFYEALAAKGRAIPIEL
jgi:hypothetical protein